MDGTELSIIIPTLNEAENLPPLLRRIHAAVGSRAYEVLIVDDDSSDETPAVCAELTTRYPVRLHVRRDPKDGLSGAVLLGMSLARGEFFVVMDADLQHPPERLPDLLAPLESGQADLVVGSRYVPGGSTAQTWGLLRRINSRVATLLARPFAGRTHDPMSGFFALRRETYERAHRLTPLGYKVALELMCKCRVSRVREVPIHFAARGRGDSKLTVRQQFKYLEHLSRLYDFCFPRASPVLKFLVVTVCGWLVAMMLYLQLLARDVNPVFAPTLAFAGALLTTAVFHARYVRTQRQFLATRRPWLDFVMISLAEWSACLIAARWVAYRVTRASAIEVFVLAFGAAVLVRYVLRKELLHDIRGLRRHPGDADAASPSAPLGHVKPGARHESDTRRKAA